MTCNKSCYLALVLFDQLNIANGWLFFVVRSLTKMYFFWYLFMLTMKCNSNNISADVTEDTTEKGFLLFLDNLAVVLGFLTLQDKYNTGTFMYVQILKQKMLIYTKYAKCRQYTYGKWHIYLHPLGSGTEKLVKCSFSCLFLKLVQIKFIFDMTTMFVRVYCSYI